jgi:hypothetical protein
MKLRPISRLSVLGITKKAPLFWNAPYKTDYVPKVLWINGGAKLDCLGCGSLALKSQS